MNDLQFQYRNQFLSIISLQVATPIKIKLLEGFKSNLQNILQITQPKHLQITEQTKHLETSLSSAINVHQNCEILETTMSECSSSNQLFQRKDLEELEENIIQKRLIKFENYDDIQTIEEELFEIQKIVKARTQFNDYLKKQIDLKMEKIQHTSDQKNAKDKDRSYLNKSLDTVAGIFKIKKLFG